MSLGGSSIFKKEEEMVIWSSTPSYPWLLELIWAKIIQTKKSFVFQIKEKLEPPFDSSKFKTVHENEFWIEKS